MKLSPATLTMLITYMAGITAFGSWLGRSKRKIKGYFLANQTIPF